MQHLLSPLRLIQTSLRRPSLCLAFSLCLLAGLMPTPAAAQYCQPSNGDINFGTVSPDALTDSQNNLSFKCQSNASATYFRICVYVAEGSPRGSVADPPLRGSSEPLAMGWQPRPGAACHGPWSGPPHLDEERRVYPKGTPLETVLSFVP
jgi:hypothetical protein